VRRTSEDPRPGRGAGGAGGAGGVRDAEDAGPDLTAPEPATGPIAAGEPTTAGEASATRAPRRFAVRRPVLAWAGGLVLVAAGLFTLYFRQSLLGPFNSDGASDVLQAQAMLHGNVLLKGWWSGDASFSTTELPEYALVELFRGVRPEVVHICGALTYTLMVLLAALLARGRATGRAGLIRALVAGGIMLAPAILGGSEVYLENPNHAGTAVPILALFLLLDRLSPPEGKPPREHDRPRGVSRVLGERWWVPVIACLALAWIQVADELTLVAATAPIAGVAVVRLGTLAVRRRPLAEYRYDALLLAAAAISNELANLAQKAIRALGGYYLRPLPQQLIAPRSEYRANAHMMLQVIRLLFGADSTGSQFPQLEPIARLHWIGLALAAAGLLAGVVTFLLPRTDRVSQIVTLATVATLVAGTFGTLVKSLPAAHEVAILLPLGAVLAGRMLPPLVPARWLNTRGARGAGGARGARTALVTGATVVFAAWLAASLAAVCYAASWTPMGPPEQRLVNWLVSHHYTDGLAQYWQGSATTVASGGRVLVAPITPASLQVRQWETSAGWYDPAQRDATFVIAAADPSVLQGGLSVPLVRHHFGRPAHEYTVGPYEVMVYDYNLLTKVSGDAFPGN
jgi:hypothetical protein